MTTFLSIKTLDDLAIFFGFESYDKFKGLIYPTPVYRTFELEKKSGGTRTIETPGRKLKDKQRILAHEIRDCFGKRSPVAHSFIKGRSVVTNALSHVGRRTIVRLDLKDFFHQINFGRVKGVFQSSPFSFSHDVAAVLAHMCCLDNRLPQGAPTSPAITNFVCLPLDRHLHRLARRYKARYTRYADDLIFSFGSLSLDKIPKNMFLVSKNPSGHIETKAGPLIIETIEKQGFKINVDKTRGMDSSKRQMVTGIVVNKELQLPRKFTDQIRRALFIWRKHGLEQAKVKALPVLHNKVYASGYTPVLMKLIRGKLAWLGLVTGRSSVKYQQLAEEFNKLVIQEDAPHLQIKIDPKVRSFEDAKKATWFIEGEGQLADETHIGQTGTAFRVKEKVWITCAHCVGDFGTRTLFTTIKMTSQSWPKFDFFARVVDVDWDLDLAVLRPQPLELIPNNMAYFEFNSDVYANADAAVVGSRIGVMGFPSSLSHQSPIFMRAEIVRVRGVGGVSRIEIDKQLFKGNSGGPIFDESYKVLGVVVEGTMEDRLILNSCIAISQIGKLKFK
jgi:RNA-directed DNA polymerase